MRVVLQKLSEGRKPLFRVFEWVQLLQIVDT